MNQILFATGIECSYPKVQNGKRRDQLAETGHYKHWRQDFELCRELGVRYLRYGPPYYRMHVDERRYDWSFTDEVLPVMKEMGIVPILDLCHFGLPDWAGDFQNEEWPELFADFAGNFARRYPWIQFYTPANEILVCAKFSGKLGWWNEQKTSDKAMITAHINLCSASLLAIERILQERSDAIFIQSEAAEAFFECSPENKEQVEFQNQLRFLTFDYLYGHPPRSDVLMFLMENGVTEKDVRSCMERGRKVASCCVMGMDYYASNERMIGLDGEKNVGPVLGWANIARDYYQRYHRPMMLTETNSLYVDAPALWLWQTWQNVERLRKEGVPVIGFTWYSLGDQVDWDIQLREIRGNVNPVGLFTLDREPRPTAFAFRELVERYGNLPLFEDCEFGHLQAPPADKNFSGRLQSKRGEEVELSFQSDAG